MRPAWHIVPGLAGAVAMLVVFRAHDGAGTPAELEAAGAIASGWAVFGLTAYALPRALRRPSRVERLLQQAGHDADYSARRAVALAEEARDRLTRMREATAGRSEPLRAALHDLEARMGPLLDDIISNPETARRADDLLRRTLPRLESSLIDYCDYAERGDGVIDTEDTRARMIGALETTASLAHRARRAAVESAGEEIDVSLSVLESTLAHPR